MTSFIGYHVTNLALCHVTNIVTVGAVSTIYMGWFHEYKQQQCKILRIITDETDPNDVHISQMMPNGSEQYDFDWALRETYEYKFARRL